MKFCVFYITHLLLGRFKNEEKGEQTEFRLGLFRGSVIATFCGNDQSLLQQLNDVIVQL